MASSVDAPSRWRLDGVNAVVTGATKGIGAATVEELCGLGASVVMCARHEADVNERVSAWRAQGLSVMGVVADVSTAAGRACLVEAAASHFGGVLHVLVSNVGTNVRKSTVAFTADEFETIVGTNFTSTFSLCQLLKPMLARGAQASGRTASIVFNSSVAGVVAISSGSVYAATKAALNQLAKNLACEWGRDGIRVNAVCPWYTETPLAAPVLADAAKLKVIVDRTPLGRIATAPEVAGVMCFLCMPVAGYVTGQSLCVDGGFTVNGNYTF